MTRGSPLMYCSWRIMCENTAYQIKDKFGTQGSPCKSMGINLLHGFTLHRCWLLRGLVEDKPFVKLQEDRE